MADQNKASPGAAIAACIAAACTIAVPFLTKPSEGFRAHPYMDVAGGHQTVCFGETQVAMHTYTLPQCEALLERRMERDFAPKVLACVPGLAAPERRGAFASSIDFAYNAGPQAFCRSSMARNFRAGRWAQGCQSFMLYTKAKVRGRLKVLGGLVTRRARERTVCLGGN